MADSHRGQEVRRSGCRRKSARRRRPWVATTRLGDYDTARDHCQTTLTLNRRYHDLDGEAATLDSLGYIDHHIDHHTGHHAQAINHHHALTLFRDLGNTYETANTLDRIGHPYLAIGQTAQAHAAWQEALRLYREQGRHDDAARVQRQLDDHDHDADETPQGTASAD